jgi:hypothetical protein
MNQKTPFITSMKGVFFALSLLIQNYIVNFMKRSLAAATAAPGSAGSGLGSLGLGAISGFKPAITFQAECRRRNHFFNRSAALGTFTGG